MESHALEQTAIYRAPEKTKTALGYYCPQIPFVHRTWESSLQWQSSGECAWNPGSKAHTAHVGAFPCAHPRIPSMHTSMSPSLCLPVCLQCCNPVPNKSPWPHKTQLLMCLK